ncbi:DUF3710 domain-containing protein [Kribbella sandramycini]|uniref:DUF3710 domain-containing protein n=1 Tax=Kribbella sandramycini TaxID=60450 RepID=A0A7Y4KYY1_9ACTN|nr:hypothetical protein [Kribbella sandramycini]NOL41230.1 DUF3710 domain-containing protein [Kribbella sandramycini]
MIFRRKAKNEEEPGFFGAETDVETDADAGAADVAGGPFDSTEVEPELLEADDRIDLGALNITGLPGMELRLQVDEQSGAVQAILLVLEESALELRAFAAPKKSGIWDEVRQEIADEANRMGGSATEAEGPFGTELVLVVPVEDPDGKIYSQTSRVIGVDGPRWLLRATVLGRAAVDAEAAPPLEETLRKVVVVRGTEPMAVRESLPLTLPPGSEPIEPEEG